jgi:chorismate synthase
LHIDFEAIDRELMRRKGVGAGTTARKEADRVEFLSGLKDGITLGTPIAFSIHNVDAHSYDYAKLEHCFRPGHADYTYYNKYGIRDHRGGGRASARETVARVVAGTIAKQLLSPIIISAEIDELGDGQTQGGIIKCRIEGVQAGIGEPVFGKLNASLAAAMMSIPSAIGFEMGAGFAAAKMSGEEYIDRWHEDGTTVTNHCGGVQGGISNGMPIEFRVAFHPVVTLPEPVDCLTEDGRLETVDVGGRHDRCQVLRTPVIVESMAALCLINYIL